MEKQEVLALRGIKKTFSKKEVLKNVNMSINKGEICGFIGKNGAGKSTTIRIISGLIKSSEGEVVLFGDSDSEKLKAARCKIGGDVDAPTFYKGMSARKNLEVFRRLGGKSESESISIDEALDIVGLHNVGKKKVGKFSTGMKQRLVIARSLINKPEILILDEPSNGLDPNGMVEMRKLITKLAEEYNMTILISSHILGELEKIATRYCFIADGTTIEEITEEELRKKFKRFAVIRSVDRLQTIAQELKKEKVELYNQSDDDLLCCVCKNDQQYEIIREIVKKIDDRSEVFMRSQSLEEYYFELVGE